MNDVNLDQLVHERKVAYDSKDYKRSDYLRNFLDQRNIFCFDLKDGTHEVYYIPTCKPMTRNQVEQMIRSDRKAEANFNDWAYRHSNANKFLT